MPKIHELSEALSNQIAAGEVIERPASVIKELVENSLDAGATQVEIRVIDAGLTRMQITDNGTGIAAEDVLTAFKRHATSKIATVRDLFSIRSLGFRGEALASIASVADVVLETATADGQGVSVHLTGGQVIDQHQLPLRRGTTITVGDLFYNTPARLKYVRSQTTEMSHIADIVNRLALGHPDVAFTLMNGDKLVLKTAGNGDLQQTIAGIYGVAAARGMLAFEGRDDDFVVDGYVSLPDNTRASRQYLTLLINGRYFKNYQLAKGVIAGYGSKLMVGRYPVAVVNIRIDPKLVDVNVHPTKQEVRISKEHALADLLTQTIYARIAGENLIPAALHNLGSRAEHLGETPTEAQDGLPFSVAETVAPVATTVTPSSQESSPETPPAPDNASPAGLTIADLDDHSIFTLPEKLAAWDARYQKPQPAAFGEVVAPATTPPVAKRPEAVELLAADATTAADQSGFPHLRYLAQMHGTYLLAETPDSFYMVDQHAAQERVNYEFYRVAIGDVTADQQQLLTPIVLEYPYSDAQRIHAAADILASVGVRLEPFGENSFLASSHPAWFKAGQEEDTLREMIDWVLDDRRISVAAFREKAAIMMSCKRAIKANQHLDRMQAQALLDHLGEAENPYNCPHGRPVVISFSESDLERMFKRIQDSHDSQRWE